MEAQINPRDTVGSLEHCHSAPASFPVSERRGKAVHFVFLFRGKGWWMAWEQLQLSRSITCHFIMRTDPASSPLKVNHHWSFSQANFTACGWWWCHYGRDDGLPRKTIVCTFLSRLMYTAFMWSYLQQKPLVILYLIPWKLPLYEMPLAEFKDTVQLWFCISRRGSGSEGRQAKDRSSRRAPC